MDENNIMVISESDMEEKYGQEYNMTQCDCDCPDGDCCTDY